MTPEHVAVIFERVAELVKEKKSTSGALEQVAAEIRAFDKYCHDNYHNPKVFTTDHLRKCKL